MVSIEPLIIEDTIYTEEPPPYTTEWEDRSCCCQCCECCRRAYFPVPQFTICGHWITSFPKLFTVVSLFICSFGFCIFNLLWNAGSFYENRKNLVYIAIGVISFSFICLTVSYASTVCLGPGYLPYSWSTTRKTSYTWEEQMYGVAVYQEQVDWAKNHDRPQRCSFSMASRRFVMRADHFCQWTQSWVGLRNHRFFVLTTLWATIYLILYIVVQLGPAISDITSLVNKTQKIDAKLTRTIILLASFIVAIYLLCFAFRHFLVSMINLSRNQTITERYNKRAMLYDTGSCVSNFEQICGPRWSILLWWLPIYGLGPSKDLLNSFGAAPGKCAYASPEGAGDGVRRPSRAEVLA